MRKPFLKDITKEGKVEGGWQGVETWYFPAVSMGLVKSERGNDLRIVTEGPGIYHETRIPIEHIEKFINDTKNKLEAMTRRGAEVEISNEVYKASGLFESLEHAGKVRGNGHHMMQRVAEFAENLMKERWIDEDKKETDKV